jgi:hypothetical protein
MSQDGRLLLVNLACDMVRNTYKTFETEHEERKLCFEYAVSLLAFFGCVLSIGQLVQVKVKVTESIDGDEDEKIHWKRKKRQLSASSKPADLAVDAVASFLAQERIALKRKARKHWGETHTEEIEYFDKDENVAVRLGYYLRLFTSPRFFAGTK